MWSSRLCASLAAAVHVALRAALVRDPQGIARYLRHLGLPTEAPTMAVPSGPRAPNGLKRE